MKDALVVGAGLTGLACALRLKGAGASVRVLEARAHVGGVAGTDHVDGHVFERGPTTVRAKSPAFRALCDELGLAERLIASSPEARERYLFHGGRLRKLPGGPLSFLASPLLSLRAKLRLLSEPFRIWPRVGEEGAEPSAARFFSDRVGEEVTRLFVAAFVRGIYAGSVAELGARSAFPRVWRLAEDHGGIARGFFANRRETQTEPMPGPQVPGSRLLSFPGGLGELTEKAGEALGEDLTTGRQARSLERSSTGWSLVDSEGETHHATAVVLAVGALRSADLVETAGADPALPAALRSVRHADVSLVHLGLAAEEARLPSGFGFLTTEESTGGATPEGPRAMGTLFASNLFPGRAPEGRVTVTSFYPMTALTDVAEEAIPALAARDLASALGHGTPPTPRASRIIHWHDAIPQYSVGHAERIAAAQALAAEGLPGVHLAGNFSAGVAVDQVIARGRAIADAVLGQEAS